MPRRIELDVDEEKKGVQCEREGEMVEWRQGYQGEKEVGSIGKGPTPFSTLLASPCSYFFHVRSDGGKSNILLLPGEVM